MPALFNFENSNESQHIMLKSQEVLAANIYCKGIPQKRAETQEQSIQRRGGTLVIQAGDTSEDILTIKEIPLVVQVGSCKIQVIDTDLPLTVFNKQSTPLTVINLGPMPVLISAAFVQDSVSSTNSKYFSVQPENLFVQPNEIGRFLVTFKQQNSDAPKT